MLAARFHITIFGLLLLIALAGKVVAEESAAAAADAPAAQGDEPVDAAPPLARTAPLPPDSALLAKAIKAERRMLRAGDVEFPVFIHAPTGLPVRGVALLIPGDGQYPTAAPGIEQLRQSMPANGWTVWLLALDAPPRVHALQLRSTLPAAAGEPEPESGAADQPKSASPGTAQPDAAVKAEKGAEKDVPPTTPAADSSLLQQQAAELQQWAESNLLRIATAVQAAKSDGQTVAVAEASAVALLRGYLSAGDAQQLLDAAIIIEPVELSGLGADWPQDLKTPVLELLTAATRMQHGLTLRQNASTHGLSHYRQAVVSLQNAAEDAENTPLSRTVRGWLSTTLPQPDEPAPASD